MTLKLNRRLRTLLIAGAAAPVLAIAGCAGNSGGDTTCSEFAEQSQEEQRETISTYVQEQSGSDSEPAALAVDAAMVAVTALCAVENNGDTPIREADLDPNTNSGD
ncbi:hypothetical protein HT102_02495 [Hoyosella sp. G463]|uniref:Uncharacterized protein n=1 Tax=Lolliginicoccus lacisalsi TaxID=2742202 RepID=A0A927PLG4_9ACTN|nr:hypothetical protein [Lolliginicoccus lacisalsi]MBD8505357.1 hypothetical protein [Lolliginicoccus lacisalsi]